MNNTMSSTNSDVWVAASTHHHKEGLAIANLQRQGFQSYCPMIRKKIRHSRRLKDVLRPLFPGYIFINLDTEHDQWRPIISTIGVRTLICFGDQPGVLPDSFVETLLSHEEDGALPPPKARSTYEAGETVTMRNGPFDGLMATVLAANDSERIIVLMEMLKQKVRVSVAVSDVVPA